MPKMINEWGQEFSCSEDVARAFEGRGIAKRVSKGASKPNRRRQKIDEHFASIAAFVEGSGDATAQYAHLVPAIIEGAEAAAHKRTANAIIQAGEIARAGGHKSPLEGVAAQIIRAGKKARGEIK